jgi:RNA polymerase sigma-70 factor (ECF subfamily)
MSSSARIPDIAHGPPPGMPLNHGLVSDDVLIAAARWGDQQAFVELCERYSFLAKRKILRILRNHEDTEDALQDTLLRAYTHLNSFRESCKFSTWLTTIGVNSALMMMRKRRGRGERYTGAQNTETLELHEIVDHTPGPEEIYSKKQTSLLVRGAVQALHPRLRSVVDQYYGSENSLKESASALDISLTAAKSRLGRSRARLRSSLAKRGISRSSHATLSARGSRVSVL